MHKHVLEIFRRNQHDSELHKKVGSVADRRIIFYHLRWLFFL